MRHRTWVLLLPGLLVAAACWHGVAPLKGDPAPAAMPPVALPQRPYQLVFDWAYSDDSFRANGDGVARVLPPNRVRLDFFLRNGSSGGYAILIGDSLFVPGMDAAERVIPPVPMLWAAFNRLAIPSERDTTAVQRGSQLTVDLGNFRGIDASSADGTAWRITFSGTQLARLDRIDKKRIVESVVTDVGTDGKGIRYFHERAHRRLTIVAGDTTWVTGFGDDIWQRQ